MEAEEEEGGTGGGGRGFVPIHPDFRMIVLANRPGTVQTMVVVLLLP